MVVLPFGFVSQRKFRSKTSELRTNVQGQSCHHVITMSTSEKESKAVGESNKSRTREFTGVTALGAKPCVFFR